MAATGLDALEFRRRVRAVSHRHPALSHPGGSITIRSPSSERSTLAFALSAPSLAENSQSSTTSMTSFTLPARSKQLSMCEMDDDLIGSVVLREFATRQCCPH